jgi:hypothetical protein
MNMLNAELARTIHADRLRTFETQRARAEARRTRPATRTPEPAAGPRPGLLARLVPWFGVRAHTA